MKCHADAFAPTKGALSNAFTIALLLSGGVQRAEAALLDSIEQMDSDQVSDDEFLASCVKHATIPRPGPAAEIEPVENAALLLPPELKRILLLPAYLRHRFVLRVLLKLSLEECAHLNIRNANQGASAAAQELARIREDEHSYTSEKVVGINHWIS
jgi:hypothetical protein